MAGNQYEYAIGQASSDLHNASLLFLNLSTLMGCASDLLEKENQNDIHKAQALIQIAQELAGVKSEFISATVDHLKEVRHA
ncbi:hypothetical protein [Paraburkholderia saeva]|uniref:Uncharacterized protein n=1 Tax=Paraburkholderia saeva TaxID=2777537 RepID=A0A9N8S1J3_9BURK|nr:hypothetical protein [Paraburkholderia saeva]CAG4919244.1 hypothetical protein LMG31841_04858 [Paraburkholderia saeva]